MKTGIIICALAFTFSTVACSDSNSSHASHEAAGTTGSKTDEAADVSATKQVRIKQADLNAIYQHYLHLSNALVKENASEIRIAAAAIYEGAQGMQESGKIASSSKKIMESNDIDQQRSSFSDLSNEFISLAKKSGLESGELYVDYCPMAMNNAGAYWLASTKEIINPYYGDEMLNCGEIKETIK